ncbi:MAG: rhodanese-like domain-containing protein [Paracoccaceae bacterium]
MRALAIALSLLAAPALAADPVNITQDSPSITVDTPDGPAVISRNQDPAHKLEGDWALTSRPCPPFCIQPVSPADGVRTIGEARAMTMLGDPEAVVIDSRTPEWFEGGSIPGAINMPYTGMADQARPAWLRGSISTASSARRSPRSRCSATGRGAASRRPRSGGSSRRATRRRRSPITAAACRSGGCWG